MGYKRKEVIKYAKKLHDSIVTLGDLREAMNIIFAKSGVIEREDPKIKIVDEKIHIETDVYCCNNHGNEIILRDSPYKKMEIKRFNDL